MTATPRLLCLLVLLGWGCESTDDGDQGEPSGLELAPPPAPSPTGGAAGMTGMTVAPPASDANVMQDMGPADPAPMPPPSDTMPVDTGTDPADAGVSDASTEVDAGPPPPDPTELAAGLHELTIDVPCLPSTPVPLADQATCDHTAGTQRIEREVTFGGDAGTTYAVMLRVLGIWEPTNIEGGQEPVASAPFNVGGSVGGGNAIDYQQYSIEVSAPAQTYWLNDHGYTAHDIHKVDYQATLEVQGGATVTVIMNDGNERQIANWTEDYFEALASEPSTGQMLRLEVVSVTADAP
jgi:hypothetical protein